MNYFNNCLICKINNKDFYKIRNHNNSINLLKLYSYKKSNK
jgi:hypothetical protein